MQEGLKREHLWPASWSGLLRLAKSLDLSFELDDSSINRFCVIEAIMRKLVDFEIEEFYKKTERSSKRRKRK